MSIIIENVSYSYGDKIILDDISLSVRTGEKIGIVGISGGGKSTLLKLLSGLYTLQSGNILVDGESKPDEIRRKVSVVMQNSILFPASILENITCGHVMCHEHVMNAIEAAQLFEWVNSLPGGLETYVGERNSKVSGGQAQRISIARAMAKDAPVVLLDEATSSLDGETGEAVLSALSKLSEGKTVISVSHKPETLKGYDRIYRLEGGKLYHA